MKKEDSGIKISIITPYYKTLEGTKALAKIIEPQLTKEVEWIIVDDGCNEEALDELNAKVIHQQNGGVSSARNTGLDVAVGKYILFVDSDDMVKPNIIEKWIEKINKQTFCYGLHSWEAIGKLQGKYIIEDKPPKGNTCVWNGIYSREAIGNKRFNEKLHIGEDEEFNKIVRKGKKVNIKEILYTYNSGRLDGLTDLYSKKKIGRERPTKASLLIYQKAVSEIGGLETVLFEMFKALSIKYDITFVYKFSDEDQLRRYKEHIKCIKYTGQKFECDKYICASNQDNIADNVISKENWYAMMIQADYSAMKWRYIKHPKINVHIAVSDIAKAAILKQSPDTPCHVIYNLLETPKIEKPLILISGTRLSWEKGEKKMYQFEDRLVQRGIKHVWLVFTDHKKPWYRNMAFLPKTLELEHYIGISDYYVTCSMTESWGCSTDLAYKLGVPVIATDYPAIHEQGMEVGVNGFILNQDMSNMDEVIDKMVENNLKGQFTYKPKDNVKQWVKLLGEMKAPDEEWKKYMTKYLVRATRPFDDTTAHDEEGKMIHRDSESDAWIVDEARRDYLMRAGAIVVVREILEKKPTPKKKAAPKKTTKKKDTK